MLGIIIIVNLLVVIGCWFFGFNGGEFIGKNRGIETVCKQAYAAKVHDKIEACVAWKAAIDKDNQDKLGVK